MTRPSFREQVLRVREDAIVSSVNRLLAEKGFDQMTVDEVAADVGIAKASLYKHFASKEELAGAAMVRVLDLALAQVERLAADQGLGPLERLQALTRWAMLQQLAGEMPSLPSQNSTLRSALMASKAYVDRVMDLSERLGAWITNAQAEGAIDAGMPPELVLYTLYARACDPVLSVLKAGGSYDDERIAELVLKTCFDGLRTRAD
jgi:AcrR family transcriptional regulator